MFLCTGTVVPCVWCGVYDELMGNEDDPCIKSDPKFKLPFPIYPPRLHQGRAFRRN